MTALNLRTQMTSRTSRSSCWPFVCRASVLFVLMLGLFPMPPLAEAAPMNRKTQLELDREVVGVMQTRDRGQIDIALGQILELIRRHPSFIPGHRLYQEMAVLARRSPVLLEAEYRHFVETRPEEPLANLLHASATLSAVSIAPELLDREVLRDIERKIALAEGDPRLRSQALLLSADIARWAGDFERYQTQLEAARKADKWSLTVRSDQSIYLSSKKEWEEATETCLSLIADAPWRLISCAALVPDKAGAPAPSQKDQARLIARVEKIEKRHVRDAVTLQSLHRFYLSVGEKRGGARIAELLRGLDESWSAPVERNPYASALPGGELSRESIGFIETLQSLRELAGSDPAGRLKHLRELASALPDDPRMVAYYFRELAFLMRHPEINDTAGSLEAIRKAWEATPEDPSVMNELAYMSATDGRDLEEALSLVNGALERILGTSFQPMDINFGESFAEYEITRGETVGAYLDTRGWIFFKMNRFEEARRDLEQASLMTRDGTVQSHLGRTRHALGNKKGAFHHLVRGLALGTEESEEVRALAEELYDELHAIPGGLEVMVTALQQRLLKDGMKALGVGGR
jgi:tetratricopeptide (TPR) repeat protein